MTDLQAAIDASTGPGAGVRVSGLQSGVCSLLSLPAQETCPQRSRGSRWGCRRTGPVEQMAVVGEDGSVVDLLFVTACFAGRSEYLLEEGLLVQRGLPPAVPLNRFHTWARQGQKARSFSLAPGLSSAFQFSCPINSSSERYWSVVISILPCRSTPKECHTTQQARPAGRFSADGHQPSRIQLV